MQTETNSLGRLIVRAAGGSDVGCVRGRNEDAFCIDAENGIFIVADGVGGHGGGDIAAQMATKLLPEIIRRRMDRSPESQLRGDQAVRAMLQDSLQELGRRIREAGAKRFEHRGMGATVVVALLNAKSAHIAHMGDSRAYLMRGDSLRQLTEDHSIVAILLRNGEITEQEAKSHPAKSRLSRYVGMEAEVPADAQTIRLQAGDRFLLCSDGIWSMLSDTEIQALLLEENDTEAVCRNILSAGKQAGGKDNLTAVVCALIDEDKA